jgi:hypothetical protein
VAAETASTARVTGVHSLFPPTLTVNVLGHVNVGVAHVVADYLRLAGRVKSSEPKWQTRRQRQRLAYRKLGYHAVTTSIRVPPTDTTSQTHAAQKPRCKQLQEIFTDFGFDTSDLARW